MWRRRRRRSGDQGAGGSTPEGHGRGGMSRRMQSENRGSGIMARRIEDEEPKEGSGRRKIGGRRVWNQEKHEGSRMVQDPREIRRENDRRSKIRGGECKARRKRIEDRRSRRSMRSSIMTFRSKRKFESRGPRRNRISEARGSSIEEDHRIQD